MERHWRICIDAGHGGNDPGAVGPSGSREADINLAVALELAVQFDDMGIMSKFTRTGDDTVSLSRRVELSRGCDGLISIHCNAFHDYRITGLETLFPSPGGPAKSLANYVHQQAVSGHRDRGIKMSPSPAYNRTLYVLRMSTMPAILVEMDFLSNPDKEKQLTDRAYQSAMAYRIACGVRSWIRSQGGELPEVKPRKRKKRKKTMAKSVEKSPKTIQN